MTRLTTAAYIVGYALSLGACVACVALAPWWLTAAAGTAGAVALGRWVWRVPLGGP